ncbi:MAG: hypothetical protein II978_01930 [Clostridia bacterium]|nr:hypothetical protein [Clostridia bacterium]
MYKTTYRKKRSKWWLAFIFIISLALGLGVGYAGAKLMALPDKIEASPQNSKSNSDSYLSPEPTPSATSEPLKAAAAISTPFNDELPKMPAKEGFLVKTTDGKVCVYKIYADGTTTYSQTLPVDLDDLPEADRKKLLNGIYLETRTELAELTEDYSS